MTSISPSILMETLSTPINRDVTQHTPCISQIPYIETVIHEIEDIICVSTELLVGKTDVGLLAIGKLYVRPERQHCILA